MSDNRPPTNQIKSSERQNKVFAKTPIGPCIALSNLKMTTTTESKINVILDKPSDWLQWFFIIQDIAKTNEVWEYIDPATKKDDLPKLEPPKRPTPKDILPTATSITQLDQNQFAIYSQLYTEYKDDLRVHEKQKQAINGISNYIVRSTSVAYLPLIDGLDTVHERLQELKKALAPTTSGRKHDVLIQYTALKAYDTNQSMDKWLNDWRNIYKLAEQLELPDVQGYRPHYDFVRAIKPISSSFAGALEVNLIRKERKNKAAPSIIDLIEEFKEHYRMQQASTTTTANHSAFATLENNSNSNSTWHKKCICGFTHRYDDCYYITKQKRPQGWKPDPDIQNKIDEMISSIPWVESMVNRIRKNAKEELEAENTESIIDFDSKTSASKTPTCNAAMFSIS
jgi:hypothetical protein